ncbi:MAG: methyltransferase domain-containing protein [Candidatus Eisenbacteria bacterium]|nr:methyltransferase domain-containing protein [Candidatus Latescibacterota bacterium]MBD3302039.1 methyltransferase domain-containing protein [Candidatus Eisenbacteria bacterium]
MLIVTPKNTVDDESTISVDGFHFRLPELRLDQDEEWFEVRYGGEWHSYRLHDYAALFEVPGLYEALVYGVLGCRSPQHLARLFQLVLDDRSVRMDSLRILDVGAGNGIMGECLKKAGAKRIVGVDILDKAAEAAARDRPDVYEQYHVLDLAELGGDGGSALEEQRFDCLTTVAALGFGDIPPEAFANALDLVKVPGWIAMTIKEDFLESDEGGFSGFLRELVRGGVLQPEARSRIIHRKSIDGRELFYVALVASKIAELDVSKERHA